VFVSRARTPRLSPHAPSAALYPAAGTRWQWQWQQRGRRAGGAAAGACGWACACEAPCLCTCPRPHASHAHITRTRTRTTHARTRLTAGLNAGDAAMDAGMAAMDAKGMKAAPRNMFLAVGGKAGAAGLSGQELEARFLKHQRDAGECSGCFVPRLHAPARPTPRPARQPRRRLCAPVCDGAAAWALCGRRGCGRVWVGVAAHALARALFPPARISHTGTHTHAHARAHARIPQVRLAAFSAAARPWRARA